ncbi:hypothetical protein SHELI_v1c01790 [Spiroplasma helicoides]|uniref:Uncharacterized protein n=1 Tax=Spiroplasma helicoides TaxID=216938 RepID=A0A1B3SJM8_9MOLU|nr:hypothetical protein [Spiroplasma helicoides]AOG60134.1 hypothetical protein SHELI_v1c01790 [Spiroplasma helicoides]
MVNKVWDDLLKSSNDLIKNFDKSKIIDIVKDFSENLIAFSEIYSSNREAFFKFLNERYKKFIIQCTNIISSADSVAAIMQLNEGTNDYFILINLFRQLMVTLDSLSSEYWLQIIYGMKSEDSELIKFLVTNANKASFELNNLDKKEIEKKAKKFSFLPDKYYNKLLNKGLWEEVKNLEKRVLAKPDGDYEYFKQLVASSDELADDMIVNLWAMLAIAISYLDYLNKLLKG